MGKRICVSLVIVVLLGVVLFCVPASASSSSKYGGGIRIGLMQDSDIVHPIYTSYGKATIAETLIFSRLFCVTEENEIKADLAYLWDVSEDQKVYTFYLREDAQFHDLTPVTANDVIFSYQQMIDPKNKSPFFKAFSKISAIEKLDAYTVRFTLKSIEDDPLWLFELGILPEHLLKGKSVLDPEYMKTLVGSGCYQVTEFHENGGFLLSRFKGYYGEKACLDTVDFVVLPKEKQFHIAFFREEIDVVSFLSIDQFQYVQEDPLFNGYAVETAYAYAMLYNFNDAVLSDKRVRHAIAHGISVEKITEEVFAGYGSRATGPFHPRAAGFNKGVKALEYSPQRAIALLKEVGYDKKEDSLYREKNGETLQLKILMSLSVPEGESLVKHIALQLAEIGVSVEVVMPETYEEYLEVLENDTSINTVFTLLPSGFEVPFSAKFWFGCGVSETENGRCGYKNQEIEELVDRACEEPDTERQRLLFEAVHELLYEDQPACFLGYVYFFHAARKEYANFENYFSLGMPYYELCKVHVKPEGR